MTTLMNRKQILAYVQSLMLDDKFPGSARINAAKCLLENESHTSHSAQKQAKILLDTLQDNNRNPQ